MRASRACRDAADRGDVAAATGAIRRGVSLLSVRGGGPDGAGGAKRAGKARTRAAAVGRSSSSRFISLSLRGGACRVCDCEDLDTAGAAERRSRNVGASAAAAAVVIGGGGSGVGLSSRCSRKERACGSVPLSPAAPAPEPPLPDDVLEMILARLPVAALLAARCVCRKWRDLTATPQFQLVRSKSPHWSPMLLLFGVSREACEGASIHALDVSGNRWHRIRANRLSSRYSFSVAAVGSDVYILGGRSAAPPGVSTSPKVSKGVVAYSPIAGSWRKLASMRHARSRPVVGVFEMSTGSVIGTSAIHEADPRRASFRRRLRDVLIEDGGMEFTANPDKPVGLGTGTSGHQWLAVIAVGGRGCWDEPLESAEIYDTATDKWVEIASLPTDFGPPCSGTVCGRKFYVCSEADKLLAYDLDVGLWNPVQTAWPPHRLREYPPDLLSCDGRLFMSCVCWSERDDGGPSSGEKAVRKLFEQDTASQLWRQASQHPDAPMDPYAAFAADQGQIYGVEMVRVFGQVLGFTTACPVLEGRMDWRRVARNGPAASSHAEALSCRMKSLVALHL